jgi:hypothetical protein
VEAADGSAAHYSYGIGFANYRGSTVQQRYCCIRGLDAAAASNTVLGTSTDAALVLLTDTAGSATRNLEIDLVSVQEVAVVGVDDG